MSKKNIKNNKKNSTRKNYKIEALEPRLMMDADSSFDPETSSLATVYTNLESAVEAEVLNKTDDVNSAAVFLKDSSDNDISEVDLSRNSKLKYFYCHNNHIRSLQDQMK